MAAAVAFLLRTLNARAAFHEGLPVVWPFDELYHWKRIAYSAANFPSVLEFDRDRGLGGAFCPWPPLYDLAAAAVARLFGATDPIAVLSVVIWIPPVVAAIAIGITVAIAGRDSLLSAAVAAVGLATAPFLVFQSSIADIDHHFLEPFLAVGIAGAAMFLVSQEKSAGEDTRAPKVAAMLLFVAIGVALMVQTALIIAAGLAFVCILVIARDAKTYFAAAVAFGAASLVVTIYRATRPDGFPDSSWFLGWTHAVLLATAAAALAIAGMLERARVRRVVALPIAIVVPSVLALIIPGTARAFAGGLSFFGGEPWLMSIQEFQPVWTTPRQIPNYIAAFTAGGIAAIVLLFRAARDRSPQLIIAAFTIVYIVATLPRRRFNAIGTAFAIIAAALVAGTLSRDGRKWTRGLAIALAILVVLIMPAQLAMWHISGVPSGFTGTSPKFLRAANLLRDHAPGSRALVSWSYGHMFDVIGRQRVVLDNFGTMPDPALFRRVHSLLLSTDDREIAAFCDRHDIRFIAMEPPQGRVERYAMYAGLPIERLEPERTWYWRAYFGEPKALAGFRRMTFDDVVLLERISGRSGARRQPSS